MGIAQLDKMVVIVQDYNFKPTKDWNSTQSWLQGSDMDLDRPILQHKYNHRSGREASLFDIVVNDSGHCRLQFNPSRIELSQVESALSDKGFSCSLIDATMYRLDLQKTQVLKNPAFSYHQLLNLAARKQRSAVRVDNTWYSNQFKKGVGGLQVCFYDAAAKHKSLNPGSCRLEARLQGVKDCCKYGVNSVSDLAHIDSHQLYVRLVSSKLPYLHSIEESSSTFSYQVLNDLLANILSNTKKGGGNGVFEFLAAIAVSNVAFNCNIDLIEAVIKNQIKDDSKASHWRRKVRDFATKVNTGLLKNFNTGLTMAQELRLFIAA
jgi:hypothetical protein